MPIKNTGNSPMSPPLLCFLFHRFLQETRCLSGNHWKPSIPKTSWTGMQHNLTLKLWTTQANSSWASHMEMLSAAVFLQRCKDLSAPPRVYCHACNTSVQCGNPWVQKTRLVSPNKKGASAYFPNSLEGIKYLRTSKAAGGKAHWEKWYLRVITRLPHF